MKAALRHRYGNPDVLTVKETAKPVPREHEVLVRIYATTVNRTDCGILKGSPAIIRLFTGLVNPTKKITGTDFAGVVEAVGSGVTDYHPGDRVFGFDDNGLESHAEYTIIPTKKPLSLIPDTIDFDVAAASLEGAHYAYNYVLASEVSPGDRILVNGATGAIGSAAVQMYKYFGANVTAVANTANLEMVRSLGADRVIDYQNEDFTKCGERFKVVLDAVGKSNYGSCMKILYDGGYYMSSELGPGYENIYLPFLNPFGRRTKVKFPVPTDIHRSIDFIGKILREGAFRPVIDRKYPLDEIVEAFRYVDSGKKTGNVLLDISSSDRTA